MVANFKGAGLDDEGGDGAPASVYPRFHDYPKSVTVRIGAKFANLGEDNQVFQEVINTLASQGRYGEQR